MLLQDFFASARPHRLHKKILPKSAVHYLYYLKSNSIIGQRKTTDIEKQFYPLISFIFLYLANTCK